MLLLGDGGSVCNLPLPLLLSQGARRCICLINVGEALPSREDWDPYASELPPSHLPFSEDLAALFGIHAATLNPSKDLSHAQVFPTVGFAPLIASLQAAMATGRGAVATSRHVTVRNDWWAIPGGESCSVAWGYIAKTPAWEAQLPEAVRQTLPPPLVALGAEDGCGDADPVTSSAPFRSMRRALPHRRRVASLLGDASRANVLRYARALFLDVARRRQRRLDSFPQYPLTRLRLSAGEANALYQQSGWVVAQHADLLGRLVAGEDLCEADE